MSDEWKDFLKNVKKINRKSRHNDALIEENYLSDEVLEIDSEVAHSNNDFSVNKAHFYDQSSLNNIEKDDHIYLNDKSRLDGKWQKELNKGKRAPDSTIDLHGYNRNQALQIFVEFILENIEQNNRLLLVITGKGYRSSNNESVLKGLIEDWCNIPYLRPNIIALFQSHKSHGGDGAFYIILKRKR